MNKNQVNFLTEKPKETNINLYLVTSLENHRNSLDFLLKISSVIYRIIFLDFIIIKSKKSWIYSKFLRGKFYNNFGIILSKMVADHLNEEQILICYR